MWVLIRSLDFGGGVVEDDAVAIARLGIYNPSSTVPNRLLRPRAEGEQVSQPENGSSVPPQLPQTAAYGSSLGELGQFGVAFYSGCQTLHHSDKLSGVNELNLGQSN
jgi:hypothetical protein